MTDILRRTLEEIGGSTDFARLGHRGSGSDLWLPRRRARRFPPKREAETPPPPTADLLATYTPIRELSGTGKFTRGWFDDFNEGHRLFGSETVTEMWQKNTRIWSLDTKRWRGPEMIRIAEVSRDEQREHYRVRLRIAGVAPFGHWLQITDGSGVVHGCMLPRAKAFRHGSDPPTFDIFMDRARAEDGRAITRFEVDLADQRGALGYAATLWRRYTTEHVGAAVQESEAVELRRVIEEKIESPLAATIAAIVLLRANRLDRLPQSWLMNLARWFPYLPDGAVLYAERRLREKETTPSKAKLALNEAAESLLKIRDRGIPRTSEAFDYAVSLVGRLKNRKEVKLGTRNKLEELSRRLDNALSAYRTGGLFSSFSGLTANLNPDRLWWEGIRGAIEHDTAIT